MDEQWVEIFRAGTHTDMAGNTRTWTTADLDEIVAKYNPAEHEAPIVIGHPEHNAPAYGWAKALRRNGEVLEAEFRDVDPVFSDAVKAGHWKKRSISLYADKTLRHVGFLGALPPAVKGLKDVSFATGQGAMTFDFATTTKENQNMDELEKLQQQLTERDKQIAQFGTQVKALQGQLNTVSAALETERGARREGTLENFCEDLIEGGHILPADKPAVMELFGALDTIGKYSFAEEGITGPEALVKLLKKMPNQLEFSEHATHKTRIKRGGVTVQDFGEEVDADRMAIHDKAIALSQEKKISYAEAVVQIMTIEGE